MVSAWLWILLAGYILGYPPFPAPQVSAWLWILLAGYSLALLGAWMGFRRAQAVTLATWLVHTLYIGWRWIQGGHPPFANLYDTLVFFSWSLLLADRILNRGRGGGRVAVGVLALVLVALGFSFFLDDSVRPLLPALQSHWISLHVVSCFIAYGAFGLSFVAGARTLWAGRSGRRPEEASLAGRLCVQSVQFGFPFLTVGIIVGSLWANEAWGTYWSWDPKETWALVTWLIYAIFLHGDRVHQWSGQKTAALGIAGFLAVLFSFIGVNFLLSGLHGYL